MGLRKISGEKIKQVRGNRSQDDIAAAANGSFTKGALSQWENELTSPKNKNILALCAALDCTYEQISVEVTESALV